MSRPGRSGKGYFCKFCGEKQHNLRLLVDHEKHKCEKNPDKQKYKCKYCGKEFESGSSLGSHTRLCKLNPNYKNTIRKSANARRGRKLTMLQRAKHSVAIKKAYAEGRMIGWHWRKNKQTKAEAFFEKVINTEFVDKDYKIEHHIGPYAADFAWLHKFIIVEIDGCQHEKPDCKIHDQKRDEFIKSKGWKILRIKWSDMCRETKYWIRIAIDFVDNAIDRSEEVKQHQRQKRKEHLLLFFTKMKHKQEKPLLEQLRLQQLRESCIDPMKWGSIGKIAKLWNVSHTYVKNILRMHNITSHGKHFVNTPVCKLTT